MEHRRDPHWKMEKSVGVDWDASLGPENGLILTHQVSATIGEGSLNVEFDSLSEAKVYTTESERLFSEQLSGCPGQYGCSSIPKNTFFSADVPEKRPVSGIAEKGDCPNAHRRFAPYPKRENKGLVWENAPSAHDIYYKAALHRSLEVALVHAGNAAAVSAVLSRAPWLVHGDRAHHALYNSTQLNKPDIVGAMLAAGVDPNSVCACTRAISTTPLHVAVMQGFTECLQLLLAAGADVNARQSFGCTALHLAAFHDHTDTIRTLVKRGALVNAANIGGYTPLHTAVQRRNEMCVTALLHAGADSKLRDSQGHEPICYAWTNGDFKTGRVILWFQIKKPFSSIGCDFPKCKHDMEKIYTCSLWQSTGP